ncbi:MAG: methionine adenosyltransferase domain-containing protein, partial [Deltaproteobacteria bacterium]|nr:methionine adenosyltransferase domain-containing protein [Deltaproteobacteria bacterium]
GVVPSIEMTKMVQKEFDMRPVVIIEQLDLLRPIYKKTASYGHFGRELDEFTWEKTDLIEKLKKAI